MTAFTERRPLVPERAPGSADGLWGRCGHGGLGAAPTGDGRGAVRALGLARGLRIAVVALCALAAVGGWLAAHPTVVGLALVIAAEEVLEISVVIGALRRVVPATDDTTTG